MTGTINTQAICLDINPTARRADRRIRSLTAEQFAAYIELMEEAVLLNAATGSDYINGEFSVSSVLKWADFITADALDALVAAELVWQVDGDRWAIDFTGQTPHATLQQRADGHARSAETRRAQRGARTTQRLEAEDRAQHKRELSADRSQRYRDRKATPELPDDPDPWGSTPEPESPADPHSPWVTAKAIHDHRAEEQCPGCRRFMCDGCVRETPGIEWCYAPDGVPWCSDCRPRTSRDTTECRKCEKYGKERCFDHGLARTS